MKGGPSALPAAPTRLALGKEFVLHVAYLPHGGPALEIHQPHLGRGKAYMGELSLFGHQLGRGSGAAHHLSSRSRLQLYVVYEGSDRDILQRQGIPGLDIGIGTGLASAAFVQSGVQVYGFDIDPEMLALCKAKWPMVEIAWRRRFKEQRFICIPDPLSTT